MLFSYFFPFRFEFRHGNSCLIGSALFVFTQNFVGVSNRHGKTVTRRFLKLCHNQSHATFSFGKTELSFNLSAFAFVLIILPLVPHFTFFRSTLSSTGQAYSARFAKVQIISISIDLICQNTLWIMACTLFVTLNCFL